MNEDLRLAAIEASKLFKKGKYEDAVDICTLGISDYPQYSSLYLILAKSYLALGNISEAHKVFESASKFFVNDPLINTLKDILEATPSINSEPSKKKTQQVIEKNEIVEEIVQPIIEDETTELSSLSFDEITSPENIVNQDPEHNELFTTTDEELNEELIQEIQIEETVDTMEMNYSDVIEQEQEETEIVSDSDEVIFEEVEVKEPLVQDSIEQVTNDEDVDDGEIEFDEVLNGFDQIVSALDTEEEIYDEEGMEDASEVNTFSHSSEIQNIVSFDIPPIHTSTNNFIQKIRTTVTPIEQLQFSIEKQHFLQILPSVSEFAHSINKVHHVDDFQIELENPLQEIDIVSSITKDQMNFEDTYLSKRKNNSDVLVFDNSIEGIDSIESLHQFTEKKA